MKSERIFQTLSETDEELLCRCERDMKSRYHGGTHHSLLRWCAAAAACLCLSGGFFLIRLGEESRWPVKEISDTGQSSNSEMAVLPHWDELPVNLQYSRLVLDGAEYGPVGTAQLNGTAAVLIGRAELSGTDPYTNEVHNTQADVFTLQEVSDGCVAAVRFDGDDDFYIYVNSAYRPQTLGQFIDDLGLLSHLQFSSAWYYYEKKMVPTPLLNLQILKPPPCGRCFLATYQPLRWMILMHTRSII